jgi:hypothetical protein
VIFRSDTYNDELDPYYFERTGTTITFTGVSETDSGNPINVFMYETSPENTSSISKENVARRQLLIL